MNVGFAMILLDNNNKPLWTPPIIKDTIIDEFSNINLKKDFLLLKSLSNIKMQLKIKCKCRGLDINTHPKFLIIANITQNGNKIDHADMDGDLKLEVIDVTFIINFN
jgi:hypothetical protein